MPGAVKTTFQQGFPALNQGRFCRLCRRIRIRRGKSADFPDLLGRIGDTCVNIRLRYS